MNIEGTIARVIFHRTGRSASGLPFLIASLHTSAGTVTVKGEMAKPARGSIEGERFRFYGEFKPDGKRPGESCFAFDHYEELIAPGTDGIVEYLRRHVVGLGLAHACRIVDALGPATIHLLRTDPDAVDRVAGLPSRLPEAVKRHFAEELEVDPEAYARLCELLADQKFPRRLIGQLLKDFGSSAPQVIRDNPYILMDYPRVGWELADAFAMAVARYPTGGTEREVAALAEALARIALDGHTVASHSWVETVATGLLKHRPAGSAWAEAQSRGVLAVPQGDLADIRADTLIAPGRLDAAERAIAGRIAELRAAAVPVEIPGGPDLDGLTAPQQDAVRTALRLGFLLLVGGPGTGKTTTVARLIACLLDAGMGTIRFLGPTGKAAKRGEELIRRVIGDRADAVRCSTIHRAIGIGLGDDDVGVPEGSAKARRGRPQFGHRHGRNEPMPGDVFVIDEMSMTDVRLLSALLDAIPLGALVLLVGDLDQLPSVGPGAVLRDLLAAGLPTITLTDILRSDGGGTVVRACHAIKAGRMPEPAASLTVPDGPDNWIHEEVDDPSAIAATVRGIVAKVAGGSKLGLDPLWDVQVVCAQHRTPDHINCDGLNALLSGVLNRTPVDPAHADLPFRPGDKVLRTKNKEVDGLFPCASDLDHPNWRWDGTDWTFRPVGVVNGDMGLVKDVVLTPHGDWAVVEFRNPTRLVRLPVGAAHLRRAYAVSCHSFQGSGAKCVIVPVHNSYFFDERSNKGLWCREWFYTALSRAELLCITVGQRHAIRTACRRQTLHVRQTRLVEHIRVEALTAARRSGEAEAKALAELATLAGAGTALSLGCEVPVSGLGLPQGMLPQGVPGPDDLVIDLGDGGAADVAGAADEPANVMQCELHPTGRRGLPVPAGDLFDACEFVPF